MSEKVFVRKECHDVYEYVGACPKCGKHQRHQYEVGVDIQCSACAFKEIELRLSSTMDAVDSYAGSLITYWSETERGITMEFVDTSLEMHRIKIPYNYMIRDVTINDMLSVQSEPIDVPNDKSFITKLFKGKL